MLYVLSLVVAGLNDISFILLISLSNFECHRFFIPKKRSAGCSKANPVSPLIDWLCRALFL
jgi:hypothetical protein